MKARSVLLGYIYLISLFSFPHGANSDEPAVPSSRAWYAALEKEKAPVEIIESCEPNKGIVPICNVYDTEDLALLPSRKWILFVERVYQASKNPSPPSLSSLSLEDHAVERIYIAPEKGHPLNGWGANDCKKPPGKDEFLPLGIDLFQLESNRLRLLVVNTSERHSIEFFEITESPATVDAIWHGCVKLPTSLSANSVASIPSGGFVVSTYDKVNLAEINESLLQPLIKGEPTGSIYEWTLPGGWREIPQSLASQSNGILVSPDSKTIIFQQLVLLK